MNRAIHAAAPPKRGIGRVDDCIDAHCGNVASNRFQSRHARNYSTRLERTTRPERRTGQRNRALRDGVATGEGGAPASRGRKGAGSRMTRQWTLAALVAATALAFAGAADASTAASSPPAPRRASVSPRRSAAGASATAAHAVRAHHAKKHHRSRHAGIPHSQEIVESAGGIPGGGSPPQPARRSPATNHHADLRPLPHSARPPVRMRSGWQGSAAEASAGAEYHTAMKRLCVWSVETPLSNEDRLILGRGPPLGSMEPYACSSSQHPRIPEFTFALLRCTTASERSKTVPFCHGTGPWAVPTPAAWEGAVACLDSPSVGDCT